MLRTCPFCRIAWRPNLTATSIRHSEVDPFIGYPACVFQQFTKSEAANDPKAQAALNVEWDKLRRQKVWLEDTVEEIHVVKERALKEGRTGHFGRVFGFAGVKHAELTGDQRKYKGRVVF